MQFIKAILRWLVGVVVAAVVTLALFLILPIMQAIGEKQPDTVTTEEVNVIQQETPPDIEEPEPPEPEEQEEPEEPELNEEPLVADISQLDLALDGVGGVGIPGADTTINIDNVVNTDSGLDDGFGFGDLDQDPRVLYQESPKMTETMRRKTPATVVVVFIVDKKGRVANAAVQSSTDAMFERSALTAVQKWRFEPGQRKGKPVESRMRIPITFPKD